MPGIFGLVTKKPPEQAKSELRQMLATLQHEPFYRVGTWINEALGLYVGWVAHRGSFADPMPISNERGDIVLLFSGEEYPEPGAARRLAARGHSLELDGPSYLVHVYEDDPAFPENLNGRFHGIVADLRRQSAMLFNDRFGMHRMYVSESADAFYFAAEAKAILAVRQDVRRLNATSLGEFVACNCVMENRTLFEGVTLLPAAASWTFRDGVLERRGTYFEPSQWEDQSPVDLDTYYNSVRNVLTTSLPRYFNGHQPIGIALTGGLDTRVIMALAKPGHQSFPCYTFGSMFRETQDVHVARRVAGVCGQPYQVIPTGTEFLSRFAQYAERSVYLTDGCADLTRTPDLYVSERAREIAPVKITGTYGSEVFTLVPTFKPRKALTGLFVPDLSASLQKAESTYARLRRGHPLTFTAFHQSPWWHHGTLSLEQTQLTVRSPYLDNDFVRVMYRTPALQPAKRDVRRRLIADEAPRLAHIRTDLGVGGSGSAIPSVSRALLMFSYKAEYSYDYAMPQRLAQLDHVLAPLHLERLFLGRHKMYHFRLWYRDALSEYVREMLLDKRTLTRSYLDRRAVEAVVHGHLKGNRNYTHELHKLLTLELVHRLFLDAN